VARGESSAEALSTLPPQRWSTRAATATFVAALVCCALSIAPSVTRAQTAGRPIETITGSATARSYRLADSTVSEQAYGLSYRLAWRRLQLTADGTALAYRTATDTIRGHTPFGLHTDLETRPGDTISLFYHSAADPVSLSARQAAALGSVGTSTVDLASFEFGTPATGGGRAAFAFPVGDAVMSARVGVDIEPRPASSGTDVYWRGTTFRVGTGVTTKVGDNSLTGSVDFEHSSADSLGGRNLFPGGGALTFSAAAEMSVLDPLDPLEDTRWPVRATAFYTRPVRAQRVDQPDRLIPVGNVLGVSTLAFVDVGGVSLLPSLQFLHESSQTTSRQALLSAVSGASGWTLSAGMDLSIPIGGALELTPQAGYVMGSVGATFGRDVSTRRGRSVARVSSFDQGLRGGWLGLQLSVTF
jgi:hypothetical protein